MWGFKKMTPQERIEKMRAKGIKLYPHLSNEEKKVLLYIPQKEVRHG